MTVTVVDRAAAIAAIAAGGGATVSHVHTYVEGACSCGARLLGVWPDTLYEYNGVAASAATTIEALRSDVERLTRERDEARDNYRFMVERAADQKLDGYRELAQRLSDAVQERDEARAALSAPVTSSDVHGLLFGPIMLWACGEISAGRLRDCLGEWRKGRRYWQPDDFGMTDWPDACGDDPQMLRQERDEARAELAALRERGLSVLCDGENPRRF